MKESKFIADDVKNKVMKARIEYEEKRSTILAGLADNVLFEYNKKEDTIHLSRPTMVDGNPTYDFSGCSQHSNLIRTVHPSDIQKVMSFFQRGEECQIEFRYLSKEGYIWMKAVMLTIRDENQEQSYLGSFTNIDYNKKKQLNEEYLTKLDSLTKIYNYQYIEKEIIRYLSEEGRLGNHVLMIIDIDHFSKINEKFGYLFADTVLVQVAESLKDIFLQSEIVGRVGGDEFLVLLKNVTDRNSIFKKVNEITEIFNNTYTGEDNSYHMSCSIGVALYPQDGKDFKTLFRHADTASYVAQKKGAGCMMFYENCRLHLKEEEKEFYNNYDVVNFYNYGRNHFDNEITAFAVDIMSKTKETYSAMVLLLNHVAKLLNVDYVRIYETSYDNNEMVLRYSSGTRKAIKEKNVVLYEEKGLREYINLFDNGFFLREDTSEIDFLPIKTCLYEKGIQAILQCAIYEEGKFIGCVGVEDMHRNRRWTEYEIAAIYTITAIVSSYLLKFRANDKMKRKLENLKDVDQLTQLSTINKFKRDVVTVIAKDPYQQFAIVYMDMVSFKYLNDTFSYELGDQVLIDYGAMLKEQPFVLYAARENADRFVLLVKAENILMLQRKINLMNEEFSESQRKNLLGFRLNIIAGICVVSSIAEVTDAIDKANIARKNISNRQITGCSFYDHGMQEKIHRELEITTSQENALLNHEFEIYLQPKIALQENKLVGAEALIRWRRNDGSILNPDDFIPIFERNGFIIDLDYYVYEVVCQVLKRWLNTWNMTIPISVNVSRLHLNDDEFVSHFQSIVEQYDIPNNMLELELTESMVLNNVDTAIRTMNSFRHKGFMVSIDDFGAGYSSLNLLKDLKTDVLKLDKEFFREGVLQKEDKIIVSSIISMAKQLDMKVLSEGVETKMQSDFLKEIYCDMAQGYLYARPMPIPEFEQFVRRNDLV